MSVRIIPPQEPLIDPGSNRPTRTWWKFFNQLFAATNQILSSGLVDPGANGIVVRTAPATTIARTLTAGSTRIAISNGSGVGGNPSVDATEANFRLQNIGGLLTLSQIPPLPYWFTGSIAGVPGATQVLLLAVATQSMTLPVGLTGSYLTCEIAATANTTFKIYVNAVQKGTALVSAAGTTGAFTFASAIGLNVGDTVRVDCPLVPDATLANPAIALKATP